MEEGTQEYNQKLEKLKKDLPFLLRLLEQLRKNNLNDPGRQTQLDKMQKLYDLINDKSEIIKWETLLKCETVVKKLQKKMEQQTEVEYITAKPESVHGSVPSLSTGKSAEIIKTSTTKQKDMTQTIITIDDIPAPESPPPQPESDIEILPIEIPTEWRSSPPPTLKHNRKSADFKTKKSSREHRNDTNHHQQHRRHQSHPHAHGGHHHPHLRNYESPTTFHGSISKPASDYKNTLQNDSNRYRHSHRFNDDSTNNCNKNKNHQSEADDDLIYSPNTAWDSFQNNERHNTFPKSISNNELTRLDKSSGSWQKQTNKYATDVFSRLGERLAESHTEALQTKLRNDQHENLVSKPPTDVFSRLGEKLAESHTEALQIKLRNDQHENLVSKPPSLSSQLKLMTTAKEVSSPPPISAELLKRPPLSANDISKLLIETNTSSNSNSNSNTFDYGFGKQSSSTASTPSEPSTFDVIRKKLALLTKGNSSASDRNLTSKSVTCDLTSTSKSDPLALKLNPHPRANIPATVVEPAANLANVNVLPTLRPNDPRLRRSASLLNNTVSLSQTSPTSALFNPHPNHISAITSRQIMLNTTQVPVPVSAPFMKSQPIQEMQNARTSLESSVSQQTPYIPTLTTLPLNSITPQAQPPSLLSLQVSTPSPCKNHKATVRTPVNTTINNLSNNKNEIIPTDPRLKHSSPTVPFFTRYVDSSDENWDTDDNACDYSTISTSSSKAHSQVASQPTSKERTQFHNLNKPTNLKTQHGNSTAAQLFQRRNSVSLRDTNRFSEEKEDVNSSRPYKNVERSIASSGNNDNPFKRSLPNSFESSRHLEDPRILNKSFADTDTIHTKQSMERCLNSSDYNDPKQNSKTPPSRRKSMCWENQTQHRVYSNPTAIRNTNAKNSPTASNTPTDRFNAKMNDSVERSKYLEQTKQKAETPLTYGAYKEARARAAAEARKNVEANKPPETEPPIITTITPAPIANTTLDNIYRSTNMTSYELPKANIGSFKIPKKQTTEDAKNTVECSEKVGKEEKNHELEEPAKKSKEDKNKTKKGNKSKMHKSKNMKKDLSKKQIIAKTDEKKDLENEKFKDKLKDSIKNVEVDHKAANGVPKTLLITDKHKSEPKTEESLKPKEQRDYFKNRTKQQKLSTKQIATSSNTRDPRLGKKSKQIDQANSDVDKNEKPDLKARTAQSSINVSDAVEQQQYIQLEGKDSKDENLIFNNSGTPIIDEVNGSDNNRNDTTLKKQAINEENDKKSAALKKLDEILSSPLKPRRILTRRRTMIDQASAPEVDKEKLSKANAMLFEDLQERERKKKSVAEAAKANNNRRLIGEICYEKTDDGCTVSTQNIITGKRRTRTTVNFNEVQQGIAVFRHFKKLPEAGAKKATETEKDVKIVATPPTVAKVRQKPGSKPKQKPLEKETEKSAGKPAPSPVQTPPTTSKRIGKRRQTFVEPTLPSKQPKEADNQSNEEEVPPALPHVTNIFDSFIQKILNPDTDAEELINKLRDILNENEIQTLLDMRAAMSKNQQTTTAATATATATIETIETIETAVVSITEVKANENEDDKKVALEKATSSKYSSIKIDNKAKETPSGKASPLQAANKGKHYKTELDRLHDDIRDMFISEGVLTASGRRMCTFVKPTTSAHTHTYTLATKTKADDSVALEITKTKTTTNNEAVSTTGIPARKTRSAMAVVTKSAPTGRKFRKKSIPQVTKKRDVIETDISDVSTTDVSLDSDAALLCNVSSSAANLDTITVTKSESPESVAVVRNMPKLKSAKPIRLPEEDELEQLLAKTKHGEVKRKDVATMLTRQSATPTPPAIKPTEVKKRKKPCPKSKKPPTDLIDNDNEDDDDNYEDDENVALIIVKQEMLDIAVPYEEPRDFKRKLKGLKNKNELKNVNPKWHFQSRYAHVCAVCKKSVAFVSMHYKKYHCENYSSRLAPSILHQLKVDNVSVSKPILKFATNKGNKSTNVWLHRCPFCLQYKRTIFNSWMEHFISHTGEHCYECTLCHASTNKIGSIEKHMKDRCLSMGGRYLHNDEITLKLKEKITAHVCHLCNFLRLGRSNMERHYVEHHGYDVSEAKNLGYTVVLMDFENVPCVETLEEALEVEEKLSIQFNGQLVDLSIVKSDCEAENKELVDSNQQTTETLKSPIKTKEEEKQEEPEQQEESKPKAIEEHSTAKKVHVKSKIKNAESEEKLPKPTSSSKKSPIKDNKSNSKQSLKIQTIEENIAKENTEKTNMSIENEAVATNNVIENTPPKTPPKVTVSNVFMSTTDDSNDEEATTSKLLVTELLKAKNEMDVDTNSAQISISPSKAVTMVDRLSQRLKEAEEKSISPTNQLTISSTIQPSETVMKNSPAPSNCSTNIEKTSENSNKEVDMNDATIEIIEVDEEDDDWEDIEIVESAPNTSSSMTSHTSHLCGRESKTLKGKVNNLQKFSRFIAAPNTLKSRKKNNKGLKSLITLFSDSSATNESEAAESHNEISLATQKITKKTLPQKNNTLPDLNLIIPNQNEVPTNATTSEKTTSVATSSDKTTTISSTTNSSLGFRPLITNIAHLLPDSSFHDPLDLAPELTPSSPLRDLNNLTPFLGENLNGILDMDVDASSNSVCIHNIDNRETSMKDALDFVTSQPELEPNTNLTTTVTTPIVMNRVQNVGFNCTTLNEISTNEANPIYKFYCLSDRCTFLFSSEAIGLQNHFLFEHPQTKWNGYCEACNAQIKFVTPDKEFSYIEELEHLLQVHTAQTQTQYDCQINTNEDETNREQAPRIKLRRLSGDCLSTTTANSNSSSNVVFNEDSDSFSDLIRFNQPRTITLSSDESQATMTPKATENTPNEVPIEISCMSNDGAESLFKNIGNDFQITSISSGLEPNEFSNIVKNAYQQSSTSSNEDEQTPSLQISSVLSLCEPPLNEDLDATESSQIKSKSNIVFEKNTGNKSVSKPPLQTIGNDQNESTPTTSRTKTSNVDAIGTKNVEANESINASAPLPKITNVCSLSSNSNEHQDGTFWSQQIARDSNELAQSNAEAFDTFKMPLTNANTRSEAPQVERMSAPPTCDSPEPLVVSETVPVAQATAGQFVITQTVSAQYNEDNEAGCNISSKPTLGFNISISAADLDIIDTKSTTIPNVLSTSIDLTTDAEEQQQQQITRKLPPLKCLENSCNFIARHFVAMIDHIKMHDLKNDSTQLEYLVCSICSLKCSSVDDYTNHIRSKHFPTATTPTATQRSFISSTTSNVISPIGNISQSTTLSGTSNTPLTSTGRATTALTEKIRNILSGKQYDATAGAATAANSSNNKSLQSGEDAFYKEQLSETIKNMVAKTGIPDNKLYRCLVSNCNVKLNEENYHTHTVYHLSTIGNLGNGPFSCQHCKAKFNTVPLLRKHLRDHARHNFFCYICLETAPNAEMVDQHYTEQHNFKKNIISHELLRMDNSSGGSVHNYYVAHSLPLSKQSVHDFGQKLIIECQRKKAATRTHFKPNEVELLPIQAIFSRDIFCGVCQYKSKVRTNMYRHLQQHNADAAASGAANNAGVCNQTYDAANNTKHTFMDPVNPVPCLISNEKHFDRMTNLASSSHGSTVPQGSSAANAMATATGVSSPTVEATCKLRYGFVSETKRFICGVPGCKYLTISEEIFRAHLSTLHSDVRSYRCALCNEPICKKVFASERIIQHLRYHDRTMYQCEQCDYQHYVRHVAEKHVLEKHGFVKSAKILVFVRDEQQPLEGVKSVITVRGKKSKESNTSESATVDNAINVQHATPNSSPATAIAGLLKKQKSSGELNTRPLWQRNDPKRIRQIRGIPMEDEADSERLKKRLRLSEDYYDDEEDGNEAASLSHESISKLYLNCFEFGCFHCECKTQNLQDLKTHWQNTHSTASNCNTTRPFQFRLLKRLKCAECLQFFGCHWEIRRHLVTAHKKQAFFAADARTKQLVCAFCDYECTSAIQLQRHSQRQDHAANDIKALTAMQMVQTLRLESDENPTTSLPLEYVQCLMCNELFCSDQEVAKHAHKKHIEDIQRFSFRVFKNTRLYHCSQCGFASAEEIETLRHMINHYNRFKHCHFCLEPQTSFNSYMQHCYSDHRAEIRQFSTIYPLSDISKFLLQMLVLFPNGWTVEKSNLRDPPYGSWELIKKFYAEICKTSQEPPIPRLSLGRLVARKSIEARQQQEQKQISEGNSTSTAAAMQLANNTNSQSQKQTLNAKKISKRRSTIAIGHNMAGIMGNQQTHSVAKKQKLSAHIVENRNKVAKSAASIPKPPKFNEATGFEFLAPTAPPVELKPYSFYGKRPEVEESHKIFTNISFAGVNTRIPLDKFKILVHLDAHVVLEKLDVKKLCAAKNAFKYQITEECEVGSSSGNLTSALQTNTFAHVKKACPASQKYRFI